MKKFSVILLSILFLMCVFANTIYAESDVAVIVYAKNGGGFRYTPIIQDGHILVSLRKIINPLEISINLDQSTDIFTMQKGNIKSELKIGDKTAKKIVGNSITEIQLDTPFISINREVYVPVKFITDSFDIKAKWDEKERILYVGEEFKTPLEEDGWVRYSTGSIQNLIQRIMSGDVIYYQGEYWISPKIANMKEEIIILDFGQEKEKEIKIANENPSDEDLKMARQKFMEEHKNLTIKKDGWYNASSLKNVGIKMESPKIEGSTIKGILRLIDVNNGNILFTMFFDDTMNKPKDNNAIVEYVIRKNDISFIVTRHHVIELSIYGAGLAKILEP